MSHLLTLCTVLPFWQGTPGIESQPPRPADELRLPPGFAAERLFDVPRKSMGSWVALARGTKGRLIASSQKGGLFRITPAALGDPDARTEVEKIRLDIGGAQGLLWAFDSLYVVVNGEGSGLYRIRDTDGDDRLDHVEKLRALSGAGEHGPHAVVKTPDGKGLFVVAGNHTALPRLASSRVPRVWQEDLVLPRIVDPRGHARGIRAPGGWVCRVDPDGKDWVLWSIGYRNSYDLAVHPCGELFTYDADMEWDMGMPWYRPTRICHVVSGSDFGWRTGSGKWRAYYPDTLPAVHDVGPGSPTAVLFGTGARFPARYGSALYAFDWTFGTIWAVHLERKGASFTATREPFVVGVPLAVTDGVIGQDGAFCFVTGGRGTRSRLYRVAWRGDPVAEPTNGSMSSTPLVDLRRRLESFHGRSDPDAVGEALASLGHEDPFIAHAARIALESQPLARWRRRVLALDARREPRVVIRAMLALTRHGGKQARADVLRRLGQLPLASLDASDLVDALRTYGVLFARTGELDRAQRQSVLARLAPLYPHAEPRVSDELVRLLAFLDAPQVVAKTLPFLAEDLPRAALPAWADLLKRNATYGNPIRRMLEDPPPTRAIHLAYALRTVRSGWTRARRRAFFSFLNKARRRAGGASYEGFLRAIRDEALETCPVAERHALRQVLKDWFERARKVESTPPKGPGRRWTLGEALPLLAKGLRKRDFKSGRNLYHATTCASCHRFDGEGGAVGPDLTTVANKYRPEELLESILDPGAVIADLYVPTDVTLASGKRVTGYVADRRDGNEDGIVEVFPPDPNEPPLRVRWSEIRSQSPSKVSPMPPNLVDALNPDELLDLIAYLVSGGNKRHRVYR